MDIEYILTNHLLIGISFGIFIGGFAFILGLGINYCLKLFNS